LDSEVQNSPALKLIGGRKQNVRRVAIFFTVYRLLWESKSQSGELIIDVVVASIPPKQTLAGQKLLIFGTPVAS
jgi:hypothetical protein